MSWQPIETAPRDGQEIIAYGVRHGSNGYTAREWTAARFSKVLGRFIETKPAPRYSSAFTPTHWMPLPQPPEGGQE